MYEIVPSNIFATNIIPEFATNIIPKSQKEDMLTNEEEEYDEAFLQALNQDAFIHIQEIVRHANALKKSGQMIPLLLVLERLLKAHTQELEQQISTIHIDEKYKITLPEFNHQSVQLNHLTKVVYVFFCSQKKAYF